VIRVLLVDDHPVVRSGYMRLLDQSGDIAVIADVDDADAGYAAHVEHAPDVTVTDLAMRGGGLELIRRVRLRDPHARVLVFSMHGSAVLVRRALDFGASGFVTKASPPDRLVDAVRAVHAGQRYLGSDLAPALLDRTNEHEAQRLATLSAREFEVFRLLAQGHTVAECAEALRLSPKTLSNLQTLVKEKLGVATLAALVHLAMRHRVISTSGS
jgi:DNA-binding NarL/FixJ family response regulator